MMTFPLIRNFNPLIYHEALFGKFLSLCYFNNATVLFQSNNRHTSIIKKTLLMQEMQSNLKILFIQYLWLYILLLLIFSLNIIELNRTAVHLFLLCNSLPMTCFFKLVFICSQV